MRLLKSVLLVAACLSSASSFASGFTSGSASVGEFGFGARIDSIAQIATCYVSDSHIANDISFWFSDTDQPKASSGDPTGRIVIQTDNMRGGTVEVTQTQYMATLNATSVDHIGVQEALDNPEGATIKWWGNENNGAWNLFDSAETKLVAPIEGDVTEERFQFIPVIHSKSLTDKDKVARAGGADTSMTITINCTTPTTKD